MSKPKTYFAQRMESVGIDPENVPTFLEVSEPGTEHETRTERPYFEPEEKGGIRINYPELTAPRPQMYKAEGNKWAERFTRLRNHPDIKGVPKYVSRKGSGVHLFFTPAVREAYTEAAPINTLYVTEGELKAWALFQFFGIPAVGLGGIHSFKEKGATELHQDLRELFAKCKVSNLVLLHDADATTPDWAKWKESKTYDLGKRLNTFFHSVIDFYELSAALVSEVYYSRVSEHLLKHGQKGIDDVINAHYNNSVAFEQIGEELQALTPEGSFLETLNMSKNARGAKLRSNVFLLPVGRNTPPEQFYTKFADILDNNEFTFLRGRYVWNDTEGRVTMQQHPEADQFVRIGCNYFKVIYRMDKHRNVEYKLEPWGKSEIVQDYVKDKGLKDFLAWIPKYDAAVNIPENNPRQYRQAVEVPGPNGQTSICYNLYHRIDHQPEPGEFPTIQKYLKHIFRGQETVIAVSPDESVSPGDEITVDRYQMALDYIQLLYTRPIQKLPIVALVSHEQHTGKSTFLDLICAIFQDNATNIGNQEITDRFNDDYATKLVICLDEGLIEKKATLEKIKAWSTSEKISVDTKNVSRQRVDFFGKIILTSNRERNFLPIDQNDSRFWITKVHEFTGPEDPDLMAKMKAEIPAFLHHLSNRKIVNPKKTRHWFSYNLLESEAKNKLKGGSKEWIESEFEAWLKEQFLDRYQWPELYFSITEIEQALNNSSSGVKFRKAAITDLLEHTYKLTAKNSSYPQPFPVVNGQRQIAIAGGLPTETVKGRKYTFKAEQFLTPSELAEIIRPHSPEPGPTSPPTEDIDNLDNLPDPTEIDQF